MMSTTSSKGATKASLSLNVFEIPLKEDGSDCYVKQKQRARVTAHIDQVFIDKVMAAAKQEQRHHRVKRNILDYATKHEVSAAADVLEPANDFDPRAIEILEASGEIDSRKITADKSI
jgi:hypothetical protein